MKKITGQAAKAHYERMNIETGEIYELKPEYNAMSRGGTTGRGIAHAWINKYTPDVYPKGEVIVNAKKTQAPRYYDQIYKKMDEKKYEQMKLTRVKEARTRAKDNTPARLKTKEIVKTAAIKQLKRKI